MISVGINNCNMQFDGALIVLPMMRDPVTLSYKVFMTYLGYIKVIDKEACNNHRYKQSIS